MKQDLVASIEVIDECEQCGAETPLPRCPENWIYIGELSRKAGVSQYKIRKWTHERHLPCSRRSGERHMYPEHRALAAIHEMLEHGGKGEGPDPEHSHSEPAANDTPVSAPPADSN